MQKFTRPSTNPCFMQVCKEAGKENYYSFMFIAVVDMEAGIARTRWTSPTKRMCPGSSSSSWEARASPSSARDTRWPTKERTGRSLLVCFSFSSTFFPYSSWDNSLPAETIIVFYACIPAYMCTSTMLVMEFCSETIQWHTESLISSTSC